jgi:hypothetical protein
LELVERRGPEAATLRQALQFGIVGCPPVPQGSRQKRRHQARKAPHQ